MGLPAIPCPSPAPHVRDAGLGASGPGPLISGQATAKVAPAEQWAAAAEALPLEHTTQADAKAQVASAEHGAVVLADILLLDRITQAEDILLLDRIAQANGTVHLPAEEWVDIEPGHVDC